MGVTIHYTGQLREADSVDRVASLAASIADSHGWRWKTIDEPPGHSENPDYHGGFHGIVIFPHEFCEPIWLSFDDDLRIQEHTKTQFAGPAVHVSVVELFRRIASEFAHLTIDDEGEYWESGNLGVLEAHMTAIEVRLQELVAESPGAEVRVKLPSGDIIDLQRPRRKVVEPSFVQSVLRWFRGA